MAKRDKGSAGATTTEGMEQQVLAFAEQLGRMAGTLQAKADGWIDREALNKQVAGLRKGAAQMLEQFAAGAKRTSTKKPAATPKATQGRSGGSVDAPGKKHRKPAPAGPAANRADSQAAKLRAAKTMVKTPRRRGRG